MKWPPMAANTVGVGVEIGIGGGIRKVELINVIRSNQRFAIYLDAAQLTWQRIRK